MCICCGRGYEDYHAEQGFKKTWLVARKYAKLAWYYVLLPPDVPNDELADDFKAWWKTNGIKNPFAKAVAEASWDAAVTWLHETIG